MAFSRSENSLLVEIRKRIGTWVIFKVRVSDQMTNGGMESQPYYLENIGIRTIFVGNWKRLFLWVKLMEINTTGRDASTSHANHKSESLQ